MEVARAKGRPMLSWVGKRPLREVQAFPSQLVERFTPETPDGIVAVPVASLRDLGATTVQTIVDRAEAKDYEDIAALLAAGVDLPDMLGSAQIVFGSRFSPLLALKALTSFEDGDLPTLPETTRRRLVAAAASVDPIPVLGAYAPTILPAASRGATSS